MLDREIAGVKQKFGLDDAQTERVRAAVTDWILTDAMLADQDWIDAEFSKSVPTTDMDEDEISKAKDAWVAEQKRKNQIRMQGMIKAGLNPNKYRLKKQSEF